MKTKLDGLLPVHAARERRALRHYHEQSQAYEAALSTQMSASLSLVRLQQSAKAALGGALEGGAMKAAEAQAMIQHAAALEVRIEEMKIRVETLTGKTQIALNAAREAQKAYALKVRTSHKLREACDRFRKSELRIEGQQEEQRLDEEFAPQYLANIAQRSAA